MPTLEISMRASSFSTLIDCPAKWEATFIKGMTMPTSSKAFFGTAVHAASEAFDQARIAGQDPKPEDYAHLVVDRLRYPTDKDGEVSWGDDFTLETAEKIGVALFNKYCQVVPPELSFKYVELTCQPRPIMVEGLKITLTGTTDRIYTDGQGHLGIADLKTGGAIVHADGSVETDKHTYQLGVYTLLAERQLGQEITLPAKIIGLQRAKTEKGLRVAIGTLKKNPRDVLVGQPGQPGLLAMAARIVKNEIWVGNPKSQLCSKDFCPIYDTCRWR